MCVPNGRSTTLLELHANYPNVLCHAYSLLQNRLANIDIQTNIEIL